MTGNLSRDEKEYAFLVATKFFDEQYGETSAQGMSDTQLTEALINGLSRRLVWGGPGKMSGQCEPVGLKIYAGRIPLEVSETPIFEGEATLKMAREIYGIPDPDNLQMTLF